MVEAAHASVDGSEVAPGDGESQPIDVGRRFADANASGEVRFGFFESTEALERDGRVVVDRGETGMIRAEHGDANIEALFAARECFLVSTSARVQRREIVERCCDIAVARAERLSQAGQSVFEASAAVFESVERDVRLPKIGIDHADCGAGIAARRLHGQRQSAIEPQDGLSHVARSPGVGSELGLDFCAIAVAQSIVCFQHPREAPRKLLLVGESQESDERGPEPRIIEQFFSRLELVP